MFFPDPQRQGEIKFILAKKLSYAARIKLVVALLVCGILIQLFLNYWAGFVALCVATALGLIKGYASKPVIKREPEKWAQVTPDEYHKVIDRQTQLKKWDLDSFDITNFLGVFVFFVIVLFCAIVWFNLLLKGYGRLSCYWVLDVFVLLAPHWVTGVKTFLKKDQLIIKIKLLQDIMNFLSIPSDVQVLPMLSTKETQEGGRVPMDARLMVRFLNAPEYFLGMQVQISLNNVQGTDYPYLYCVLLAKKEQGFFLGKLNLSKREYPRLTFSEEYSEGVDVLVVRQHTTRTSGYHTNLSASKYVVQTALDIARQFLK